MIRLTKVTFTNFKIFGEEPYTINFSDQRLILLDGPNGYGKTSVFDGIELGLTGNLERLISLEGRQNPSDIVVAHKGRDNVKIELVFTDNNGNSRIFIRMLKSNVPNSAKKISKFQELWDIYESIDGVLTPSSQDKLDLYFDSSHFKRDFLLFHYVQQEETSRFLKSKNETQRAEELAQLFGNTREADDKLKRLVEVKAKISNKKRENISTIDQIKERYSIDVDTSEGVESSDEHFYILPWLNKSNNPVVWDAENISDLNEEKLNTSLKEVEYIKGFLTHKNFFIRNLKFEKAIAQREVIQLFIGYVNSIDGYEKYVKKSNDNGVIKGFLSELTSNKLESITTTKLLNDALELLGYNDGKNFINQLNELIELEKKSIGLNSVYSELVAHHKAMQTDLSNVPKESACLLCGHDHKTHTALSDAIAKHGHLLKQELSGQDKSLLIAREAFNTKFILPLARMCSDYIEQNPSPSPEELLALSKARNLKSRFKSLREWLQKEGILFEDLLASSFPILDSSNYIREASNTLSERIRSAVGTAPHGFYETNVNGVFDRIYSDYFDSNLTLTAEIQEEQLERKKRYIKGLYFNSLKEVTKKLAKLNKAIALQVKAEAEVDVLVRIVKSKIKQYRKKLITEIEIPFYIYSGKILQSHQAGLGHGIFIKDPTGNDELKNVRLVSNWESDHDILNTMSSGQISAIVISLTLALHRVYSSRFSCILIDDPVQTMDDINMSSLVEVLRNDFKDRQVILSTHEDKVARYFTYKYLKHNESVKIVNLMQRKEYIPTNRFIYRKGELEPQA
ncbi:Chromosome segregation protein SMC [Vibrio chagasii]|nr:Chromosome segregation protein SMC [Vibrio chagasii]CAH7300215.1 Chromosome segregation protein SMC [Vibrio chagasii]CAH7369465.1 Chromosome segregation protein SMC [Vibrio chagasii]CAH7389690.1 Chromosome segregation protein SMC [Vibrio chagasii]